jgi:hypothetical protein
MADVLRMYQQWREQRAEGAPAPQVLGFTASPACKRTLVTGRRGQLGGGSRFQPGLSLL